MRLSPKPVGRTASKSPPWTRCLINRNLLCFSEATAKSFIDNGANCSMYYFLKRRSLHHLACVVCDFRKPKAKISPLKANYFLWFNRLLRGIHYFDILRGANQKTRATPIRDPVRTWTGVVKLRGLSASVSFSSPPLPPPSIFCCARPILAQAEKWVRFSFAGNTCYAGYINGVRFRDEWVNNIYVHSKTMLPWIEIITINALALFKQAVKLLVPVFC